MTNHHRSDARRRRVPLVRRVGQAVADGLAWAIAVGVVHLVDHGQGLGAQDVILGGVAVATHVVVGYVSGLYQGRFWYGSSRELSRLYVAALAATVATLAVGAADGSHGIRTATLLLGGPVMLSIAQVVRVVHWRRSRRANGATSHARKLIVFGAGVGGEMALRALSNHADPPFVPVALLDDDPARGRLEIYRVRVMGTRDDIGRVAQETGADAMLIAIPSASSETLRELTEIARYHALEVFVLPPVEELFGTVATGDIRPVSEIDLLGRHPVEIDIAAIATFVTGRRVLVTGAGGSIGAELCRQIDRFAPAALAMLDCDDTALHNVQLALQGRALLQGDELILADIRDRERVFEVFGHTRPEVVFHAAALKHLSLLEQHPQEAWRTNVLGTQNVIDAALHHGVEHFVNISTDKAAAPSSVLGWSKRIGERLTAQAALGSGRPYVSVRFGNVLGSRGSVLEIFTAQLAAGGPLTVTDPHVTRYFMTVAEAVRLTLNAAAIGRGGEVLVLDMGTPVRIDDVARRLVASSRRPVKIVYTGLRPGEKLHECLFDPDEADHRPRHPMISHVAVPPLVLPDHRHSSGGAVDAVLLADLSGAAVSPSQSA